MAESKGVGRPPPERWAGRAASWSSGRCEGKRRRGGALEEAGLHGTGGAQGWASMYLCNATSGGVQGTGKTDLGFMEHTANRSLTWPRKGP